MRSSSNSPGAEYWDLPIKGESIIWTTDTSILEDCPIVKNDLAVWLIERNIAYNVGFRHIGGKDYQDRYGFGKYIRLYDKNAAALYSAVWL